ncbi:arsenic transporter [Ignatzschineria sp. LJL83]
MILAITIFIFTLVLVIWQPRGLGIGWSASIGAILALIFGVINIDDIPIVWGIIWNATITFIAIIIISLILDEAGFFKWAALHIAKFGNGNSRKLFTYLILLGALVAAFFANDGAALIITPIVMAMLLSLGISRASTLAFVMAAGFIADTGSLPFIVSNLVNIVSADYFDISFTRYASIMLPVNIVSVITTLIVLHLFFRKDTKFSYNVISIEKPKDSIVDRMTFKAGWIVLILLLIGFFTSDYLDIPISVIASIAAMILAAIAYRGRKINLRTVIKGAPWQIVIFSLGMYLVVFGLRNAGLTTYIANILNDFSDNGLWASIFGTGILTAVLSSIMNNMPTVLVGVLSIDASSATGLTEEAMVYANVIGSDLGPKITPIGSLATLLWLHVLSQKNLKITWGYYFKVGIILTTPILLVTLAALAIRLSF